MVLVKNNLSKAHKLNMSYCKMMGQSMLMLVTTTAWKERYGILGLEQQASFQQLIRKTLLCLISVCPYLMVA